MASVGDRSESDESIDSQNENITEESDVVAVMERFVMTSSLDTTLDLTEDNRIPHEGIIGTNARDILVNVNDGSDHFRVSGHIIFNQVGNCLS